MDNNAQDYLYILRLEYSQVNKLKIKYLIYCVLIAIITFAAGYIDAQCLKNPAVLIAYTLSILPVAFLLIGCFNIVGMVDFMLYKTYKKAFLWIRKITRLLFVFYGICVGSSFVITLIHTIGNKKFYIKDTLFTGAMIIALILNFMLYRYHNANMKLIYTRKRGNDNE